MHICARLPAGMRRFFKAQPPLVGLVLQRRDFDLDTSLGQATTFLNRKR
jgi:hypothetical protein